MDNLTDLTLHFEEIGHPDSGDIRARQESLVSRFEALKEPLATRKKKLIDLLKLLQICRDSEDEEAWIQETEPSAASTHLGQCNITRLSSQERTKFSRLREQDTAVMG